MVEHSMMTRLAMAAASALALGGATPARAQFFDLFELGEALASATAVVQVSEGDVLDGNVIVTRVWQGELVAGESLRIAELAAMAAPAARQVFDVIATMEDRPRPTIEARDVLLFLERDAGEGDEGGWRLSAGYSKERFHASTMWLEGGQAYVFANDYFPPHEPLLHEGPLQLELEAKLSAHARIQAAYQAALGESDAAALWRVAVSFDRLGFPESGERSLRALLELDAAGREQLGTVLRDLNEQRWHPLAMDLLASVDAPGWKEHVLRVMQNSLAYFQRNEETFHLSTLDFNVYDAERHGIYRHSLESALETLSVHTSPKALTPSVVQDVFDLWRKNSKPESKSFVLLACEDLGAK